MPPGAFCSTPVEPHDVTGGDMQHCEVYLSVIALIEKRRGPQWAA